MTDRLPGEARPGAESLNSAEEMKSEKEVKAMQYQKPTVVPVGAAIRAIEQASSIKPDTTNPDSDLKPTDPAYRADE